ncbi:MAG TPA: 4-(cytidine 5'-diphospho)-2-C-methyl-D-erythritol kinase, partial [Caulobacter sp.]|nr:4-(cytidine 5'-diphospho)-2-C-methyl-D-erythritol kinase [Caulobacter sp.]
DLGPPAAADRPAPPDAWDFATVLDWLQAQRNDLQTAAVRCAPAVADVLAAASSLPEVRIVRMSGSGATVFALFETPDAAIAAGRRLAETHPRWWIAPTNLG